MVAAFLEAGIVFTNKQSGPPTGFAIRCSRIQFVQMGYR